jgi:hypothetical protein
MVSLFKEMLIIQMIACCSLMSQVFLLISELLLNDAVAIQMRLIVQTVRMF